MRNIFTLLALLVFGTILSKNHAQTYSIYPTPQKVVETGEAIELTQQINNYNPRLKPDDLCSITHKLSIGNS